MSLITEIAYKEGGHHRDNCNWLLYKSLSCSHIILVQGCSIFEDNDWLMPGIMISSVGDMHVSGSPLMCLMCNL